MRKIKLLPAEASYAVQSPQGEVLRVDLDGGAGFYILDIDGASFTVTAEWVGSQTDYQYFMSFQGQNRALFWLADLVLEDGDVREYTVITYPGSYGLLSIDDDVCTFGAKLEVEPAINTAANRDTIVSLYEASDGDPDSYLDKLENLINVRWPV